MTTLTIDSKEIWNRLLVEILKEMNAPRKSDAENQWDNVRIKMCMTHTVLTKELPRAW